MFVVSKICFQVPTAIQSYPDADDAQYEEEKHPYRCHNKDIRQGDALTEKRQDSNRTTAEKKKHLKGVDYRQHACRTYKQAHKKYDSSYCSEYLQKK